jgi:hypothetical protein
LVGPFAAREYRRYWFFLNLQLAIDRALLGGQQSNASFPSSLDVKVKPFPWPAKQEDIGAASAAVLLNLLLVYAFMAPTRGVVGSIVREKELRLREGMRILGLSVRRSLGMLSGGNFAEFGIQQRCTDIFPTGATAVVSAFVCGWVKPLA